MVPRYMNTNQNYTLMRPYLVYVNFVKVEHCSKEVVDSFRSSTMEGNSTWFLQDLRGPSKFVKLASKCHFKSVLYMLNVSEHTS
jgi:hypothetical protein